MWDSLCASIYGTSMINKHINVPPCVEATELDQCKSHIITDHAVLIFMHEFVTVSTCLLTSTAST